MEIQELRNLIRNAENDGNYQYRIMKRDYAESLYDLFFQIDANGYRVASYNPKTQRVIIPFPNLYIPSREVLDAFVELANNKFKEQNDEEP